MSGIDVALALFGGSSGGSSGDPITALRTAEKRQTQELARVAKKPDVARELAAFKSALSKAGTPQALLKDRRALDVLLNGFGLGSQSGFYALAERALLADPTKPDALVKRLDNSAWRVMAETLQFAKSGLATLQKPEVLKTIEESYVRAAWSNELDERTPGLSDALDFKQRASGITNVYAILGDPITRRVVTGALGLPPQLAIQPVETQARAVLARLDLKSLQNPKKVDQLVQRYLLNSSSSGQSFSTGGSGISAITSLAVQSRGIVV